MSPWIKIQVFATRTEAEIARAMLETRNIHAIVQADDAGGMRPELGFSHGASLLVELEDRIAALHALQPQLDDASEDEEPA